MRIWPFKIHIVKTSTLQKSFDEATAASKDIVETIEEGQKNYQLSAAVLAKIMNRMLALEKIAVRYGLLNKI